MSIINGGRLDRRGFLKTTAAGAIAATLPMGGAFAAPKRGGHLRVGKAHGQTTDTLNPGTWENGFTIGMAMAIHGRLTEVKADGTLAPEVAESWEATPDAKVWTFKVREGMTFHSGKSVTAEDVAASINFHRGEDSTSAAGPLVAPVENIRVDGQNVVFELSGGNADFPFILSDYHLTIHPAKDDSIDWKSADGCGSYTLKSHNFGVSCTMERNPNHWRDDVAFFDSIEMLALVDQNARTTALVSGDVDVVDRIDLKTVGLLARNKSININSVAGTQHFTFAMSANQAPFDDNNVRMALKYAINREELVEKILFGYGSVGNDVPIGQNQAFYNTELEQKTYDPDKAKWHLKEAGMDSLSVSLSAADAAFTGAVDAGVLYQNSAKAAGIDLKVVREPNDGYWSDVWMKKPFSAVYWSGRPVQDQMFATAYSCGASWNDGFWCNEKFDNIMVEARAELDPAKRKDMYWEMQEIVSNQGAIIIPMFANYVFATSEKVKTSDALASNWDMDGERWAERWSFA
ncbi:ABC transporter substrate-binding protein [Pseudohalocynthiibacter aestuariivivens]|uniref:ABC transporter substrate-binding protein n=1 Tax=Roseovarius pelagicus TaxID=2980108 RepID=A0ABY6DD79_9RHOB|nr:MULTISPECIES: ABC transporter substrate-binding protein [Rhodobacterales]QIE47341.1 ABC transporter substrate-binding protein [Pseudohalocynthiibacter aestuariivivens]UXX84097.1 ABC transporter substrate-binding protein [Roseovarius pelagicus]